ncbi:MAG: outer membrane protein assembly factor BamD [Rhodocyclaceae bacterium]|nr:MAG: outer membrane protein assembly factor BamD [Rhodocyclaceae bacterium]
MRSVAAVAVFFALLLSFLLGGCGLLPDQEDETSSWTAQKLYAEAKEAMNDGAYDKAIKLYEKLEARYPYGRYAQQAQLEVAYAYFKQQEIASAVSACDRFIRLHPNHPNVDYAYYLKGLANFGEDLGLLGQLSMQDLSERDPKASKESFDTFKELVTKFPASKYAADSTARMNYLVNNLAAHQVHVAAYYFRRGAYVAALNRAQSSLKTFPGAPANEEALFLIIRSYDALGINDLRDDSERVMRKNFPNSEFFAHGLYRTEPWWKLW